MTIATRPSTETSIHYATPGLIPVPYLTCRLQTEIDVPAEIFHDYNGETVVSIYRLNPEIYASQDISHTAIERSCHAIQDKFDTGNITLMNLIMREPKNVFDTVLRQYIIKNFSHDLFCIPVRGHIVYTNSFSPANSEHPFKFKLKFRINRADRPEWMQWQTPQESLGSSSSKNAVKQLRKKWTRAGYYKVHPDVFFAPLRSATEDEIQHFRTIFALCCASNIQNWIDNGCPEYIEHRTINTPPQS